jgi:hypothetical protein
MRDSIKFRFAGIAMMLVMCAVFGLAVMLLWNALMPLIFALPQIDYLQAAGLLILLRLLFGGMGNMGGWRHHTEHVARSKLREKWLGMSEDERMKSIRHFSRFHAHHFGDESKMGQCKESGEKKGEPQ